MLSKPPRRRSGAGAWVGSILISVARPPDDRGVIHVGVVLLEVEASVT